MVVVNMLTCCALFHSVCHLKATQINAQCSLILELMLYDFKLGHNNVEATKNICFAKGEDTVNHSTITRLFKTFHLGCKNLDNQARSGSPKTKTVESEAMLQAIEANSTSSSRRESGKLSISQFRVVHHLHDLGKSIWSYRIMLCVAKILQNLIYSYMLL